MNHEQSKLKWIDLYSQSSDLASLLQKLSSDMASEFPGHGSVNYFKRYEGIENYLNNNIHPEVEKGAMNADGNYLTGHGVNHIRSVIHHASQIVFASSCKLEPYEIYILLVAIQFHDVGNIFGREGHEKKCSEIMKEMGALMGGNSVEERIIKQISSAHGGYVNEDGRDRDTIGKVFTEDHMGGKLIRGQYLAAILRFADELADDYTRAVATPLQLTLLKPKNKIYHAYAKGLSSVKINLPAKKIELKYELHSNDITEKYTKDRKKIFLLDEIFNRTYKMHIERIYCMRFLHSCIPIDAIKARVEVYRNSDDISPMEVIEFELSEKGYPISMNTTVYDICAELTDAKGKHKNGTWLKRKMEKEAK